MFVQHCQHLVTAPIAQCVVDKINGPDVVGVRRAQADDRAFFVVKPPTFPVAVGQLQSYFVPQPFDFLVIDAPSFDAQQGR